jgi:hypothetical protein
MSTVTKTRTSRKPVARSVRVWDDPTPTMPGIVTITAGKLATDYYLTPLPSDFGRAFQLEKFTTQGEENYHVLLNGEHSTCECKGFLKHGLCKDGRGCKHIASLNALKERGKLA